jgi:hypothetical protein
LVFEFQDEINEFCDTGQRVESSEEITLATVGVIVVSLIWLGHTLTGIGLEGVGMVGMVEDVVVEVEVEEEEEV